MEKSRAVRLGFLAALALALLMVGSYFMSTGQRPESMVVSFPSGTQMTVEVADSPLLLYTGLAFRDSLPPNWGMLFIYDQAGFHSRNTRQYRFTVDIVWLDAGRRVLLITESVNPCLSAKCPEYGPSPDEAR